MNKNSIKLMIMLHMLMIVYSLNGILTKHAAGACFLSLKFILCYGGVVLILGVYAIIWQQIIKYIPLTTAYANKAVTVIWGIVWGILLFKERLNLGKIIGAAIVFAGVVLFGFADNENLTNAEEKKNE